VDITAIEIPFLTTRQMVEVDRLMTAEYGIDLVRMMENAGRNLARLAVDRFFGGDPSGKRVAVLAGTGGNGGGVLVAARRLHAWGAGVKVYVTRSEERFRPVPAEQLRILKRLGLAISSTQELAGEGKPDLVLDGILGYSLSGPPRGAAAEMITWSGRAGAPVLSLDVPSGVDASSGTVHEPAVRAAATMTLALPKTGLGSPEALDLVGELYLADIGVPPELYGRLSPPVEAGNIFAGGDLVRIR
jgi:NAD(P)H-hydrate epimerase